MPPPDKQFDIVALLLKVLNAAGFVAIPTLAVWAKIDWYFTGTRATFISIGGLLSAFLYSYLVFSEPDRLLITIPIVWYILASLVAVISYFALYNVWGPDAKTGPRWLLPTALASYVCLLCVIGLVCAVVLARHDYLLLNGHVLTNGRPLAGATLIVQNEQHRPVRITTSNVKGAFLLSLKYQDYKDKPDQQPAHLLVQAEGYNDLELDLDGHSNEDLAIPLNREDSSKP
jgi:hypothetical protein